jgi:hypothetical protein
MSESGDLPFVASGMVPVTVTALPCIEDAFGTLCDSGTSSRTSLDPETFNCVLPFATRIVPVTAAFDCFIVNPFFVMASCNCFSVVVLPGFILTAARPFSRLTSTDSTPATDFNDTRTACAQTSQSMPKMVMSIDLISAGAEAASSSNVQTMTAILLIRIS